MTPTAQDRERATRRIVTPADYERAERAYKQAEREEGLSLYEHERRGIIRNLALALAEERERIARIAEAYGMVGEKLAAKIRESKP